VVLVGQDHFSWTDTPPDSVFAQVREDEEVSRLSQEVFPPLRKRVEPPSKTPEVTCSLDQTVFNTDGHWAEVGRNVPRWVPASPSPPSPGLNHVPKLVTYDEKKTVIAEFHRARHWVKKRKARLEVQPAGMEMLDDVILTFVFADNKRREREARARAAGGG